MKTINFKDYFYQIIGGTLIVILLGIQLFIPNVVTTAGEMLATFNTVGNQSSMSHNQFPEIADKTARRTLWVVATSYSSDPYQTDSTPCLPAMNYNLCEWAEQGVVDTIAANFLRLGTKVRFPELYGDKVFTVRDRMNARYNNTNRIDFYSAVLDENSILDDVASKSAAKQFGVKSLKMEIL